MSSETATLKPPASGYEAERGKPMPSRNHGIVQARLIAQFSQQPGFLVVSELTLHLGDQDYTPDISIYTAQPVDFRQDIIKMKEPPLVTAEIFSPSQGYEEVMSKVQFYLTHGVKSCWVVVPPLRSVTIYAADGQQVGFSSGVAKDPVTGLAADLNAVFS